MVVCSAPRDPELEKRLAVNHCTMSDKMKLLACMNLGLKSCFHTSSTDKDLLLHTVLHPHLF